MMNYELKTLQQRLAQTTYQQAQEEIEELKQKMGKQNNLISLKFLSK